MLHEYPGQFFDDLFHSKKISPPIKRSLVMPRHTCTKTEKT